MTISTRHGLDRTAMLFPGAGVALCGYEREIFVRNRRYMEPFLVEASDAAHVLYVRHLLDSSIGQLNDHDNQFFTYAFSSALAALFAAREITVSLVAGYSLGIYAALCHIGAIDFSAGFGLIERAYELVHEACSGKTCGMGAVIGFSRTEVDETLASAGLYSVQRVNTNNENCQIVAGGIDEVRRFLEITVDRGAIKAVELPVSVPYHHPVLLQRVPDQFRAFLRSMNWRRARLPLVSSIDQTLLVEPEQLIEFTAQNLASPIDWQRVLDTIISERCTCALECGPGLVLTQNGRFVSSELMFINVKNAHRKLGV